jgi:dTDP-4-dehydrorhamnose reductase
MQILVTGASGRLGTHLLAELAGHGHEVVAWSGTTAGRVSGIPLRRVELRDPLAVRRAVLEASPDVIIHAGAISSADVVRRQRDLGWEVNVGATGVLSDWAGAHQRKLLFTSTDLVFEGTRSWYREGDVAVPILEYGRTKLAAEAIVLASSGGLVTRLSMLYGPSRTDQPAYFDQAIAALRSGRTQAFFADEYRTPLDYTTAAQLLIRLAESDATGIVHLGGPERVSRFELMRRAARALGADADLVRASQRGDVALPEARPADVSLDTSLLRGMFPDLILPPIEDALARA